MQGAFLQQNSVGVIEESISQQLNLAARLRHIVDIVKVSSVLRRSLGEMQSRLPVTCKTLAGKSEGRAH